jgi:hypothetical protein
MQKTRHGAHTGSLKRCLRRLCGKETRKTLRPQCGGYDRRAGRSVVERSYSSRSLKAYHRASSAHRWSTALFYVGILTCTGSEIFLPESVGRG